MVFGRHRKLFILMIIGAWMFILGLLAALTSLRTHPEKRKIMLSVNSSDDHLSQAFPSRTRCIKRVHIFGSDIRMRYIPELKKYRDLFQKSKLHLSATEIDCRAEGYDCDIILTMGSDVDHLKGKDAIVFGMVPTEFLKKGAQKLKQLLELEPEPGQTWIYFSTEPPLRVLRWAGDINFSRLKYHLLMTYDLDSEIVVPFGFYKPFDGPRVNGSIKPVSRLPNPLLGKEGMIAWMATNCKEQFWPRMEFMKRVRNILPLDDYGKCGRKQCLPRRSEACNKLMASYKFFFAIPNSECKDYITEKFWLQSLSYGTVPVVFGSRKESYEKVAPPNSYIHFSDFESIDDFVKYLNSLNENDKAYRRFYDWRSQGEVVITFPTRPTVLCRTLPHLQEKRDAKQYKYLSDSPWFKGCRRTPDESVFSLTGEKEFKNWSVWR